MLFLLLVFFFSSFLKRCQSFVPEVRKMVAQQRNPLGIQFVNSARTFAPVTHQPCLLQNPQVL